MCGFVPVIEAEELEVYAFTNRTTWLKRGERNGLGRREKRPKKIGRREKGSKKIGRRENQHKREDGECSLKKCDMNEGLSSS